MDPIIKEHTNSLQIISAMPLVVVGKTHPIPQDHNGNCGGVPALPNTIDHLSRRVENMAVLVITSTKQMLVPIILSLLGSTEQKFVQAFF
jgi:hypothetical protein